MNLKYSATLHRWPTRDCQIWVNLSVHSIVIWIMCSVVRSHNVVVWRMYRWLCRQYFFWPSAGLGIAQKPGLKFSIRVAVYTIKVTSWLVWWVLSLFPFSLELYLCVVKMHRPYKARIGHAPTLNQFGLDVMYDHSGEFSWYGLINTLRLPTYHDWGTPSRLTLGLGWHLSIDPGGVWHVYINRSMWLWGVPSPFSSLFTACTSTMELWCGSRFFQERIRESVIESRYNALVCRVGDHSLEGISRTRGGNRSVKILVHKIKSTSTVFHYGMLTSFTEITGLLRAAAFLLPDGSAKNDAANIHVSQIYPEEAERLS